MKHLTKKTIRMAKKAIEAALEDDEDDYYDDRDDVGTNQEVVHLMTRSIMIQKQATLLVVTKDALRVNIRACFSEGYCTYRNHNSNHK